MVGLISGPVDGALADKAQGIDAFAAPISDVLGAAFTSMWESGLPLRSFEALDRVGRPDVAANYWDNYKDPAGRNTNSEVQADVAAHPGELPKNEIMQPEDLLIALGPLPGLNFDAPISYDAAKVLHERRRRELVREEDISRSNSVLSGGAARVSVSLLAGLLDPLNVASAFIPIVPGAVIASRMAAASTAFGLAGRVGVRGAVGAAEGAVGQALLEPFNYAMSRSEHTDYTMVEALQNIGFGAVFGSALHVGLGGLFGRIPPQTHRDMLNTGVAQVVQDQPVRVTDILDFAEARAAISSLEGWHQQLEIRSRQNAAELAGQEVSSTGFVNRSVALAKAEENLASLREQADSLRAEHGDVVNAHQNRVTRGRLDPISLDRLSSVEQELSGVIPRARRADLEHERTMLVEGQRETPVDTGLEGARSEAQATGLSVALTRTKAQAAAAEATLAKLRSHDAALTARETEAQLTRDKAEKIATDRQDSREAMVQREMEKEIKRFAYEARVDVPPEELAKLASDIRLASPAEAMDYARAALEDIAKRPESILVPDRVSGPSQGPLVSKLQRSEAEAAQAVARSASTKQVDISIQRAEVRNREELATAPKADGDIDQQVLEMQKLANETKAALDAEIAAGRLADPGAKPVVLDRAWVLKEGGGVNSYDTGKGGDAVVREVSLALQRGDKVELIVDGGKKTVDITSVSNGMMQDAVGQRWGTLSIATDNTGKEMVRFTPQKNNELAAQLKAADEIELQGKLEAEAAACRMNGIV